MQTESAAPVLEERTGGQELSARFFPTSGMERGVQDDDDKAFRYDAQAQDNNGEPKYQDASSVNSDLASVDPIRAGRETTPLREAGFVSSVEQTDSPMQENTKKQKSESPSIMPTSEKELDLKPGILEE